MDSTKLPCTDTQAQPGVLIVDDEPAVRALLLAALPSQANPPAKDDVSRLLRGSQGMSS